MKKRVLALLLAVTVSVGTMDTTAWAAEELTEQETLDAELTEVPDEELEDTEESEDEGSESDETTEEDDESVKEDGQEQEGESGDEKEEPDPDSIITSGTFGDGLSYVLTTDYVMTISGNGPMPDFRGNDRPWEMNSGRFKTLVIEDGVTSIGTRTFYGSPSLKDVVIAGSVKSIGDQAFSDCSVLKNVTFSTGLESIGDQVFYKCTELETAQLPDTLTEIGERAFYYCMNLNPLIFPESLTTIGDYAFCDCNQFTEIIIPDSVTQIGKMAFGDCVNLQKAVIGNGVKRLEDSIFNGSKNLKKILVGDSVTSVGANILRYNFGAKLIFLGDASTFDEYAFGNKNGTAENLKIFYPEGNATWTEEVRQDYGGTNVKWYAYDPTVPEVISIVGADEAMQTAETRQLTVDWTGAYVEDITWESSDPTVVSVDEDGVATAWSAGEVEITCTVHNGMTASSRIVVEGNSEAYSYATMLLGIGSNNVAANDYTVRSSRKKSYLMENPDGTLSRVEYINRAEDPRIIVETYSKDGRLLDSRRLEAELVRVGGFYSGKDYNFLVFGQNNEEEDDEKEIFRIVKYDKDWNRVSSCSINNANTIYPFEAGSLRMTEASGYLYIYTCHEMYPSSDGVIHQANVPIMLDEDTMTVYSAFYGVMNIAYGYVSHSFNQFIRTDGTNIYRVDHGDAHLRGVSIVKNAVGNYVGGYISYKNAFPFGGSYSVNKNDTGASVGGMELSADNILIAGNSVDQNAEKYRPSGQRNIFVSITDKALNSSKTVWLTDYPENSMVTVRTPQFVKLSDDRFLVMWEEQPSGGTTVMKLATIDQNGTVGAQRTIKARLSDCEPILTSDGKVAWYVTQDRTSTTLYQIDPYNLSGMNENSANGTIGNLNWVLDEDGTLTIWGDGDMSSLENQYFMPWDNYKDKIKTVVIEAGVKSIATWAFGRCKSLTKIIFKGDAPSIGDYAFSSVQATAYYPPDNATWTKSVKKNYGGTITWKEIPTEGVLIESPADVDAEAGDQVSFTVKKSGSIESYRWESSTDGENWEAEDETAETFTLTATMALNGRKYRCIMVDAFDNQLITDAATLSVTPKAAEIHFTAAKNKTCDGDPWAYTGKITVISKKGENLTGKATLSLRYTGVTEGGENYSSESAPSDAGAYTLTASVQGEDYAVKENSVSFQILPAEIEILAENVEILAGEDLPETYAWTVKGLLKDDHLIQDPTVTCDAVSTDEAGSYEIIVADADAGSNYQIRYTNGTLLVKETCGLQFDEIPDMAYTGKKLTPQVVVRDRATGAVLKKGKDYKITYYQNINADQVEAKGGISDHDSGRGFDSRLPYVIITGKGNYNGTVYMNFHIRKAALADSDGVPAEGIRLQYKENLLLNNKKAQKVFSSIKYKNALQKGIDYTAKLEKVNEDETLTEIPSLLIQPGDSGRFLLTVAAAENGNYIGVITRNIYVADSSHQMSKMSVTVGKELKKQSYQENGVTLKPGYFDGSNYYEVNEDGSIQDVPVSKDCVFTVRKGNVYLAYGRDYEISYSKNDSVGTAEMILTGKNEYFGTKKVLFSITGTALRTDQLSVMVADPVFGERTDITSYQPVYTGSEIKPDSLEVTCAETGRTFVADRDYSISYQKNVKAGKATAVIKFLPVSGYTGTCKKTFMILPADMKDVILTYEQSVPYAKAGARPDVRLEYLDTELKINRDYTITYDQTTEAGMKAEFTITGRGNYSGSLQKTYTIEKKDLQEAWKNGELTVTVSQVPYKAGDQTYQPKVVVKDGGKVLVAGVDYLAPVYKNNTNKLLNDDLSNAMVTLRAAGTNYSGSVTVPLSIWKYKISSSTIYVKTGEAIYTGKQTEPSVSVYYGIAAEIKLAKQTGDVKNLMKLTEGKDYQVTYGVNVLAGKSKGSAKITGMGQYKGKVTTRFQIQRKDIYSNYEKRRSN